MWNELTFLWDELTILWNDLTTDWNDLTWNDLTMERNDRIPIARGQTLQVATKKCMACSCFSVKSRVFGQRMPHFAVIL